MNSHRLVRPILLGGLLLLWCGTSVQRVQPHEEGVLLRFGRVVRTLPSGMHFTLPWPADRVLRVATKEVRRLSISTTWSGLPSYRAQWLTGDTNIVELTGNVQYTVSDSVDYLFGLHGTLDSDELQAELNAQKLAEEQEAGGLAASMIGRDVLVLQITEAVLADLMARMTVDDVLAGGKTQLQLQGVREVQALLDELHAGIHISAINLAGITAPPAVIQSFNDVSSARADRERMIEEARTDAGIRIPRERSKAASRAQAAENDGLEMVGRARGQSESFAKLAAEVAKAPDIAWRRRWLEGMRQMLRKVDKMVVQPPQTGRPTRVYLPD